MRTRIQEWLLRYGPAEILGLITTLIVGLVTYKISENVLLASFLGSIGENIGYYGFIIGREFKKNPGKFIQNTKNILLEFGIAEAFDSVLIRPFFLYVGARQFSDLTVGFTIGKISADIFFYIITISIYEIRKKLS